MRKLNLDQLEKELEVIATDQLWCIKGGYGGYGGYGTTTYDPFADYDNGGGAMNTSSFGSGQGQYSSWSSVVTAANDGSIAPGIYYNTGDNSYGYSSTIVLNESGGGSGGDGSGEQGSTITLTGGNPSGDPVPIYFVNSTGQTTVSYDSGKTWSIALNEVTIQTLPTYRPVMQQDQNLIVPPLNANQVLIESGGSSGATPILTFVGDKSKELFYEQSLEKLGLNGSIAGWVTTGVDALEDYGDGNNKDAIFQIVIHATESLASDATLVFAVAEFSQTDTGQQVMAQGFVEDYLNCKYLASVTTGDKQEAFLRQGDQDINQLLGIYKNLTGRDYYSDFPKEPTIVTTATWNH